MSDDPLSHEQELELKRMLSELKADIETRILNQNKDTQPVLLDQQSVGRVSRIDAIQQQQMAKANQTQNIQLLARIDLALSRFTNKSFGLCQQCEEPIVFARLNIQPFASLCIECQENSETSIN
ncbi:MAG: DnaK suppressor protein [Gammaproteobacteria bacterium]|jgi:DnaK suppressor protein